MASFILLEDIEPNPEQLRKHFSKVYSNTLRETIKHHGLVVPITVVKVGSKHRIISGEQRFRELKALGWEKLEIGKDVVVRDDPKIEMIHTFLENRVRRNFHVLEEAQGLLLLLQQRFGYESYFHFIERLEKLDKDVMGYCYSLGVNPFRARRLLKCNSFSKKIISFLLEKTKYGINTYYCMTFTSSSDLQKRIVKEMQKRRISPMQIRRTIDKVQSGEYDELTLSKKTPYTEMLNRTLGESRQIKIDQRKLVFDDDTAPKLVSGASVFMDFNIANQTLSAVVKSKEHYDVKELDDIHDKVVNQLSVARNLLLKIKSVKD